MAQFPLFCSYLVAVCLGLIPAVSGDPHKCLHTARWKDVSLPKLLLWLKPAGWLHLSTRCSDLFSNAAQRALCLKRLLLLVHLHLLATTLRMALVTSESCLHFWAVRVWMRRAPLSSGVSAVELKNCFKNHLNHTTEKQLSEEMFNSVPLKRLVEVVFLLQGTKCCGFSITSFKRLHPDLLAFFFFPDWQ